MTLPVGIRRATTADIRALDELLSSDLQAFDGMSGWLDAPGVFTYLAEDEIPFGVVTVGAGSDGLSGDSGELLLWYVASSHRGAGWGRKLLVHGLSVLKRRMYSTACLWVPEGSIAALATLERLGFEADGAQRTDNRSGTTSAGYTRSLEDFF